MPNTPSSQEDPVPSRPWPFKIFQHCSRFIFHSFGSVFSRVGTFTRRTEPLYQTIKMLQHSGKSMNDEEKILLNNFLTFSEKTVDDIMIPRSSICAVEESVTQKELCDFINEHSHTRTFIYSETLDQIKGFIHIKDLFADISMNKEFSIKGLLRNPLIVTPNMRLIDLLAQMQHQRTHTAIVIDEYGGTDGMITIEDIMEEIVGRIEDEHDDDDEFKYKKLTQDTILVNARMEIKEIEEIVSLALTTQDNDGEFDTIGGMVLHILGYMPTKGTLVSLNNQLTAEIVEATPRHITKIKLIINPELEN